MKPAQASPRASPRGPPPAARSSFIIRIIERRAPSLGVRVWQGKGGRARLRSRAALALLGRTTGPGTLRATPAPPLNQHAKK